MQQNKSTNMAIDPICGMTVDEASALRAERDGQTFYFCSDHCRQKFLSTPATAKHEEKPQGKAIYTCPMHPEVQQNHPGDCPKCGMALEPKTVTAGTDDEENAELRRHDEAILDRRRADVAGVCPGDGALDSGTGQAVLGG